MEKYILLIDKNSGFFKFFNTDQIKLIQLYKEKDSNPEKGNDLWIFLKDLNSYIVEVEGFDIESFASFMEDSSGVYKKAIFKILAKFNKD